MASADYGGGAAKNTWQIDAEITGCFHSSDFSGAQHTSEDISSWQVGANGGGGSRSRLRA